MTIDGRLLDKHQDVIYFQTAYTIKTVISLELPFVKTKNYHDRLAKSFQQVVKTSPILQTHVVACDGRDEYKFSTLDTHQWPTLQVHKLNMTPDDERCDEKSRLMAAAKSLGEDELQYYRDDKTAAMTKSCRVHAVVGTKRVAFCIVAPHHFCDGAALGIVLVKLICYAASPYSLWPILDLMSPKKVPTFKEMTLQRSSLRRSMSQQYKIVDECILTPQAPKYFQFKNHDMMDGSADELLAGFKGSLAVVPSAVMRKVRANLRKDNMSISTAFGALAIKVLAILLSQHAPELNRESLPLLLTLGVDGRQMKKMKTKLGKLPCSFPVVANYAFDCFCFIPYDEAVSSSLGDISAYPKNVVRKLRSDPIFRAQTVMQKPLNDTYDCGVSSVMVSDASLCSSISGVRGIEIDSDVEFGSMPRVWFYVVSVNGANTTVSADIMLPIKGLNKSAVMEALSIASKDSPLEPLFSAGAME